MGLEDRALKDALARAIPPALAALVAGPGPGEAIDVSDLLGPAMLARVLGPPDENRDRRAIISLWALQAFEAVLPSVIAAAVLLGRVPGARMEWVIEAGRVAGLRARTWEPGRFADFASRSLAPFVAVVAERGGVSPRVLWSNAGHIVEAFLGMLEREAGPTARSAAIRALLTQPLVGGAPNGLFLPVRYVDGQRFRRVCCLRFLVPSWPICRICPLPPDHPRRDPA